MAERSQKSGKSRRQRARDRVAELLGRTSNEREGVDARGRGEDREGVSARGYQVDEDAVDSSGNAGESWASGVAVSKGPDKGPSTKERVRDAASRGAAAAKERASEKTSKAALKAALRGIAAEDVGGSSSRNREMVERAEQAGHIKNPTPTSLQAMGDSAIVSEMARADSGNSATLLGGDGESMLSFDGLDAESADDSGSNAGLGLNVSFGLEDDGGMWGADGDDDDDADDFEVDDPFGLSGGDR